MNVRYLSVKKILNFIRLRFSYYISSKKVLYYKNLSPYFISLEPADYCQLQCPECPVGTREILKRKNNLISVNIVKDTISELKNNLIHVIFYFQGEPLLNKSLPEYIQYAHKLKIFTSTSTNAQALDSDMAKQLVLSGLDKIIISIDGATQEVYEQYRIGGKISKTIVGIQQLSFWKKELKSITPFIEIQCIVFKTNEHQIEEMYKLANKLKVDNLVLKTAQIYNYKKGNALIPSISKYSRYKKLENGDYAIKSSLPNTCWRAWSGGVVNTNGDVLPCCFDKESLNKYGNVQNSSFLTQWHNDASFQYRNSILNNRKGNRICKNCTGK